MNARAGLLPLLPLLASMISLCVGTSYAKALFPVAGPAGMTALRTGLSALILVVLQRPWRWRLDRPQALAVARYGLVLACMNLSFYQAVRSLPLGIAIAIEFTGPLGVAILHSRRALDLLWVATAGGGILLLAAPGSVGGIDPVGVAFALLAALFWAFYIVTGQHASRVVPAHRIVCLGLCASSLIAVPVGVASAGAALIEPRVLAGGALVAVLCSALPYSLEMIALKQLPASVFGVLLSLEPAVGAAAGFTILGEHLVAAQCVGMASVIAASIGTVLLSRSDAPATKTSPP